MFRGANDIILPREFSGPAQLVLYTRYGDPQIPGWENKWITNWKVQKLHSWFPVSELRIHKHFWPLLQHAFFDLEKLGLQEEIRSCHNCFQLAHIHHSPVLSVHSWGVALDLNADDNPTGSMGTWSEAFINVMTRNHIYCGLNWTGYKEPMHFSMVDG